jgi:hypothetical protein
MFDEFDLGKETLPRGAKSPIPKSADAVAGMEIIKPEERRHFELLLLERLKQREADLDQMWQAMSDHWGYEDSFYRFYHGSFKVCGVQSLTERAVKLLRELLLERALNQDFAQISRDGTGKKFEMEHNRDWLRHTRPMLEAFLHARCLNIGPPLRPKQ